MTRLKNKYSLNPNAVRAYVKDFVDFDYIGELSDVELEWLHKFSREYYDDRFYPDGQNLHNREQRQACHRTSHARRRDVFNGRTMFESTDTDEIEQTKAEEEDNK
jgi:hypothetical protein